MNILFQISGKKRSFRSASLCSQCTFGNFEFHENLLPARAVKANIYGAGNLWFIFFANTPYPV